MGLNSKSPVQCPAAREQDIEPSALRDIHQVAARNRVSAAISCFCDGVSRQPQDNAAGRAVVKENAHSPLLTQEPEPAMAHQGCARQIQARL